MGKSQRNKGVRAELEVLSVFRDELGLDMKRNSQAQYEEGGHDIEIPPFSIEVKRQEKLSLKSWWGEAVEQAGNQFIPVLIYRQSRQPWRAVMPMSAISGMFTINEAGQLLLPEWYNDYEFTVTMLLQPTFITILREVLTGQAYSQMIDTGGVVDRPH
jgi:hypothetical protein